MCVFGRRFATDFRPFPMEPRWVVGKILAFWLMVLARSGKRTSWGDVHDTTKPIRLTDEQRIDWLRLIRSQNVGPRGIMAQTPQT
jgi:hypothetical protein